MTPAALRDGHWYSTSLPVPGAHATPDGRAVGIYQRPERLIVPRPDGTLGRGDLIPGRIVFQAPDGHDLLRLEGRDRLARVEFAPDALPDLAPVALVDHLPDSRWERAAFPPGTKLTEL